MNGVLCLIGLLMMWQQEQPPAPPEEQPPVPVEEAADEVTSLGELWTSISEWVDRIWNLKLIEHNETWITVGKLVLGLIFLILGLWISRTISRTAGKRIFPRFGLNKHVSASLQKVIFYLFALIFAMFALDMAGVPLTVFTLLGGALAIGVGFGSQNLMNNFISGVLIMVERPIRIGDLIQVGDLYGTVMAIGARSTRVRTGTNVDIIVPNSSFLEQNVVNWTLGDTKVRTQVDVGVAYGSDTQRVREVLLEAAKRHERVVQEPEPFVLFTSFGDNSLAFEIHFWISIQTQMQRKKIESDLRFTIDALCRDADIVIAFPQRDIHLDTLKPLDIRLLNKPD